MALIKRRVAFVLVMVVAVLGLATLTRSSQAAGPLTGKKVLMIIAPGDFRDEELFETKAVLEGAGATVVIASREAREYTGMLGAKAVATQKIADARVSLFDAIVFVGGKGAKNYINDPKAQEIARSAVSQNKVLAAICIAPAILAQAGVLKDKNATSFEGVKDDLLAAGAHWKRDDVVADGRIVTGNGPGAATEFGQKIKEILSR